MTVFLAGQTLTAGTLEQLVPLRARKSADQTLTPSSTTLQNVSELSVSVSASTNYDFEAVFLYDTGTTPDIKLAFTFPAGATLSYGPGGYLATGINFESFFTAVHRQASGTSFAVGGLGAGTVAGVHVQGTLIVSTTAGTFQVQAAQNTSNASDTIVKADSRIRLTKQL